MADFDTFLSTAWSDHGERPREVADQLGTSLHLVDVPARVPPYARIVTHVFGEHLGEWQAGIDLLAQMRALAAWDGNDAAAVNAVAQGIATLRHARGDDAALEGLSVEARIGALATVSALFAGRGETAKALAAYADALALADRGLPAGSPAIRALAVGGNNLAATLEEKKDRDDAATAGMVMAARSALKYWKQAGTWLEDERAEYRLGKSLLQAQRPHEAIASAQRCVAVCATNDAPAFERFFAHAVLAQAQRTGGIDWMAARDAALAALAQVPEDERSWCEAERLALAG